MKRKAPDTGRELGNRATASYRAGRLTQRLRQEVNTTEQLNRYIAAYDEIEPHISQQQRLYLSTQFAAHQEFLGSSVSETKEDRQRSQTALNVSLSEPVSIEEADPFALEEPTAVGIINRKRSRLSADENIDWSDYATDNHQPDNHQPPPPPPPAGGGSGILV